MKKLLTLLLKGDDEMMKKMLVLILVLGMASLANAVPMQLWVADGTAIGVSPAQQDYYDPVDSELVLLPSDYLWVGVYNPIDGSSVALQKSIMMLGIVTCPDIKWTGLWAKYVPPLVPGTPDNVYYGDGVDIYGDGTLLVDLWVIDTSDGSPETFNMKGVLDAKELHCEEFSMDNIVYLFNDASEIIDTIIIHQIPEPATIALLGLGGLFLRRRRGK